MALRVYTNGHGHGEGTHVSVFVTIQSGKYDAELKWPFVGKVAIALLNQLNDRRHDTCTWSTDTALIGSNWGGSSKFIPHSVRA